MSYHITTSVLDCQVLKITTAAMGIDNKQWYTEIVQRVEAEHRVLNIARKYRVLLASDF